MNVHAALEAVTIYREGAVCTRVAKLGADRATPQQIRVVGLPLSLAPGSLRATVTGGGGVRVLDVRAAFDVEFSEALDAAAEQKAVRSAETVFNTLSAQLRKLENDLDELQALQPQPLEHKPGDPPREAAVDATLALVDFVEGRLVTRLAQRRALRKQVADAQAALTLAHRRLGEASTAVRTERAKVTRVAVVTLSAAVSGSALELTVEYQVPGARWAPSYQLRLAKGFAGGSLSMRASVAQSTGEDWSGISLALSTASLTRRTDLPELKSLRIGRSQPPPPRSGWREPPQGLEALFEAYDAMQPAVVDRAERMTVPPPSMMKPQAPPPVPSAAPMKAKKVGAPMMSALVAPAATPGFSGAGAPEMTKRRSAAPRAQAASLGQISTIDDLSSLAESAPSASYAKEEAINDESMDLDSTGSFQFPSGISQLGGAERLSDTLRDYDSLEMPDAVGAGSSRGRLSAASPWATAFAMGVSVQVDVVMMVVNVARSRANEVAYLPLPPGAKAVSSFENFDYRFDAQRRLDVPSSGKWVTVPVMSCQVGLTPQYVCVPSVEPKVYRTLAIHNTSPHALLPGPVDVSAGDEFLMTTSLPAIAPGANNERLGLGVEEAIKVARKTQYTETTGGFLGGSAVMPHELSIELNNRMAVPASIEVRERVPWADPSEKDVKVEESNVSPPWEKLEQPVDGTLTNGARRWVITLPPGQSTTLKAQFTIRIPADRMLVGGNRRG